MVTTVKLRGLNKRRSRGKWYVSIRRTGESLLAGFAGTRDELDTKLGEPEMLRAYGFHAKRVPPRHYGDGTLGGLIRWFKDECPAWRDLASASQADYEKTFAYLEPEMDTPLATMDPESVQVACDKAARAKWPRFADKMASHLSKMFKEGSKRGRASGNPARGLDRQHRADPHSNHEWSAAELQTALEMAPQQIKTPLVLARYQGFRGQTCQALSWGHYINDPRSGKAFDLTLRKNNEAAWFPCEPETRAHLDGLTRTSTSVCTRADGIPWESEKQMQSAVSQFLRGLKAKGLIRKGCTLHGLRVTFAASMRRLGMDTGVVADALGDRSELMGKHYTRHVEKEHSRMRAFNARNVVQNG